MSLSKYVDRSSHSGQSVPFHAEVVIINWSNADRLDHAVALARRRGVKARWC
jgi:hypothetical protein